MQYKNYYKSFAVIYVECYTDIVKMMNNKGITRLEFIADKYYGYDRVTIRNSFFGDIEEVEVAVVKLIGKDLYIENENEYSYSVSEMVEWEGIVDLYEIVYRALSETNN